MTSRGAINAHLLPVVKSIWVVRVVLGLILHRSCSVPLREVKVAMDTVDIHDHLARVYNMQDKGH